MKKVTTFGVLMLLLLTIVGTALVSADVSTSTVPVSIDWVKINGDEVAPNTKVVVERNAEDNTQVDVRLRLNAQADAKDLRMKVELEGYEDATIRDETKLFNVEAGEKITKKVTLSLPDDLDAKDYRLAIVVSDGNSRSLFSEDYTFRLDVPRHALTVRDVALSSKEVAAGSALYATVRVENKGELAQEVKITAALDLGDDVVEATDFVDRVKTGEKKSSEELYLRVPRCAQAGEATLTVTLSYNNDRDTATSTETLKIVDGGLCDREEAHATVTLGANAAKARAGETASFPVTVSNPGTQARTFGLAVSGADDWASVEVAPANVLTVQPGESKTAFVHVTPDKGVSGKKSLSLQISEGDAALEQVSLQVDVAGNDALLTGVVVAIVVIIVILVIVGIVVGVSRARDDEDEDEKSFY
jgi:uncharacterized membrane protein